VLLEQGVRPAELIVCPRQGRICARVSLNRRVAGSMPSAASRAFQHHAADVVTGAAAAYAAETQIGGYGKRSFPRSAWRS
jgi:phage gpG-like protein